MVLLHGQAALGGSPAVCVGGQPERPAQDGPGVPDYVRTHRSNAQHTVQHAQTASRLHAV